MQPDLSQGHPGVQGTMFGCTALKGGGDLRQSLLNTTGCYGRSMHRTWRETIKPLFPQPLKTKACYQQQH